MALVQYDLGSSDSDTENEDSETIDVKKDSQLISTKRAPKTIDIETDVEQVNKKIKIAIPKIDVYDDKNDDDILLPKSVSSKIHNSNETSGLLLKLPAPKAAPSKKITTTSFIPHTVSRKPVIPKKPKLAKPKTEEVKIKSNSSSDSDNDDISHTFDVDMWSQVCGRRPKTTPSKQPLPDIIPINSDTLLTEETEKPVQLDNDAFKQLVGSSKRRIPSDVTITDIAEADMLEKTDVWMRKALTDPQYQQKSTGTDDDESSNPVAKNKHHITFLAQQAKAKEQELQAQWASGNQKRQMSRAKYGF